MLVENLQIVSVWGNFQSRQISRDNLVNKKTFNFAAICICWSECWSYVRGEASGRPIQDGNQVWKCRRNKPKKHGKCICLKQIKKSSASHSQAAGSGADTGERTQIPLIIIPSLLLAQCSLFRWFVAFPRDLARGGKLTSFIATSLHFQVRAYRTVPLRLPDSSFIV